jgi:hypothetical protein
VLDIPPNKADDITWERPILHAEIRLDQASTLHVLNVHLKSKNPASIPGQQIDKYTWRTISGWAEGLFLSSLKRVGQALDTTTTGTSFRLCARVRSPTS